MGYPNKRDLESLFSTRANPTETSAGPPTAQRASPGPPGHARPTHGPTERLTRFV